MSIGTLGNIRPADVNINDISVYYNYTPNRETDNNTIIKIDDPTSLLSYTYLPDTDADNYVPNNENILEGLYNLRLPATTFNQLGIYTIYIKPKSIATTIVDCSVLSSLPTIKGIVLDSKQLPENYTSNNALQGFRIEYVDAATGNKTRNVVRYVVTSNKVVAVSENVGNTTQKTIRYRFDDSGSLIFLQLTPSSSSDVKPNVSPFIGTPGQTILISNTYFSPLVIEVEMVENTINTLSQLVGGEQIKDVENGVLSYYDANRVITKQFNIYEIKENVDSTTPLYEVKELRQTIDETQNFDNITNF